SQTDARAVLRGGAAEPLGLVAAATSCALRAWAGRRVAAGHPAGAAAHPDAVADPGAGRHPAVDPACLCPAERDARSSDRRGPGLPAPLSDPWRGLLGRWMDASVPKKCKARASA